MNDNTPLPITPDEILNEDETEAAFRAALSATFLDAFLVSLVEATAIVRDNVDFDAEIAKRERILDTTNDASAFANASTEVLLIDIVEGLIERFDEVFG